MPVWKRIESAAFLAAVMSFSALAHAKDLKINLPKRSQLTPVQRLNREGVEAVNKHQFNKAKALFYKAYLYDPGDPFTLNNLGYIAELDGQVERAQTFYSMSVSEPTEARIDEASSKKLKGESLEAAIGTVHDVPMQVNRSNVRAVGLLAEGRVREADKLLQQTLTLDPRNAFTLNNMGVAREAEGEYNEALRYYLSAAAAHNEEPVIVTMNRSWRGKPLSQMAQSSAARLRKRMRDLNSDEAQVALLNLRGVSALNRNDWRTAQEDFAKAYKLAPDNAFSLNNQGYVSEMNGDLESAQDFYRQARTAGGARDRVGVASRPGAEGMRLAAVADESDGQVSNVLEAVTESRHRQNRGPIELKRRDGSPVPTNPSPSEQTPPQQ